MDADYIIYEIFAYSPRLNYFSKTIFQSVHTLGTYILYLHDSWQTQKLSNYKFRLKTWTLFNYLLRNVYSWLSLLVARSLMSSRKTFSSYPMHSLRPKQWSLVARRPMPVPPTILLQWVDGSENLSLCRHGAQSGHWLHDRGPLYSPGRRQPHFHAAPTYS